MAETKSITTNDKDRRDTTLNVGDRPLRTVEQTINDPIPPPAPTQAEADAILLGEYTGEEEASPPEGETQEQRRKREEEKRKQREAKAIADQQAGYQTRANA